MCAGHDDDAVAVRYDDITRLDQNAATDDRAVRIGVGFVQKVALMRLPKMTALRGVIMLSIGLTIRCFKALTLGQAMIYRVRTSQLTNQLTNRIQK